MKAKSVQSVIHADGVDISVVTTVGSEDDYISLTDIAKYSDPDNPRYIIQNWMRNRNTIDYLGLWEELNNPGFNRVEFDAVKMETGKNSFVMTPSKWVRATNAIGLVTKSGRYGGGTSSMTCGGDFCTLWKPPVVQPGQSGGLLPNAGWTAFIESLVKDLGWVSLRGPFLVPPRSSARMRLKVRLPLAIVY